MQQLNLFKILSYGAIGLSSILAVFTYNLLRAEQDRAVPRPEMISVILKYMVFCGFLAIVGTVANCGDSQLRIGGNAPNLSKAKSNLSDEALKQRCLSTLRMTVGDSRSGRKGLELGDDQYEFFKDACEKSFPWDLARSTDSLIWESSWATQPVKCTCQCD